MAETLTNKPKNRLLFTDAWLKGLKGTGKRAAFADLGERGLYVRVGATGAPTFYAVNRVKGGPVLRKKLGVYPDRKLVKAREMASEIRKQAGDGIDTRVVERETADALLAAQLLKASRESLDLAEMARWYIGERETDPKRRLAKKSALNYRALVTHYLDGPTGEKFRGRFAGEIHAFEIREMLKSVALNSPTQANRLFELVRAAYRLASYEGRLESVPALKKPAENVTRERLLNQKEIRAFWTATETATLVPRKRPKAPKNPAKADRAREKANEERKPLAPQARGALRMLLVLGQRKGETLAMRWADIDGDIWRIPGQFRKGGRMHTVPLSSLAIEILKQLRPLTGAKERVFEGASATNLHGRAFRAVREAVNRELKTDSFSIHDLRRTFATQARELCNVRPDVLADILGHVTGKHASIATTHYDKSTGASGKESALEAWAATLKKIIAGETIGGEKGKILAFR